MSTPAKSTEGMCYAQGLDREKAIKLLIATCGLRRELVEELEDWKLADLTKRLVGIIPPSTVSAITD